jgi:DnaJ-class molecular chaperone
LLKQRLSECSVCGGTGRVACKECSGHGFLPRGGYSKKNPLNLSRAVGEHTQSQQLVLLRADFCL